MIKYLDPEQIKVGQRYRSNFDNLDNLVTSIRLTNGNLQPIQVYDNGDGTYTLITGERRLRACKINNFKVKAEIIVPDDIPLKAREAIENIEREQFTWQEEVEAKQELHEMYKAMAESKGIEWSKRKSAKELNLSIGGFTTDLNLYQALKEKPELFEGCQNKRVALKMLKKIKIEEATIELANRQKNKAINESASKMVYNGDCLDIIDLLPEKSVDCLMVDTPFGINYESKDHEAYLRTYDDNLEDVNKVVKEALIKVQRVLKDDASFCIFCGYEQSYYFSSILKELNYIVCPVPGIWYKPGSGQAQTQMPQYYMGRSFEFFIYGFRGNATLIKQGMTDSISVPRCTDKQHPTQKPIALYEELISRFCLPGQTILDFMCGSGSSLVAGIKMGCKVIGIELDPYYYSIALNRVVTALNAKNNNMLHTIVD